MRSSTKSITRPRILLAWGIGVTILVTVGMYHVLPDYRKAVGEQKAAGGTVVLDRKDRLLRVFPDGQGRSTLWRGIDRFPECLKRAAIAAEDKRFYSH